MQFGPVPVRDSIDTISAHSIRLPSSTLRKGTRLEAEHVSDLLSAGIEEIVVARLDPSDVDEDEASRRIAAAIAGPNVRVDPPFTGRANLFADRAGLLRVNRGAIDHINRIDPAITFATLDDFSAVEAGRMVATVKTIAFAVAGSAVEAACALPTEMGQLASIAPFRSRHIGVVATVLPSLKPSVLDKTRRVLDDRLEPTGSRVMQEKRVAHNADEVAGALRDLKSGGAEFFIVYGASAIADRDDVIPAGIRAAGGRVEHFGMPVDPGNLLLVGELSGLPVIGAPGCARSPKENGFDWILNRLLADIKVNSEDITGMGVGGLLMEIVSRPQPRAESQEVDGSIAAIVLAAGQSRRMGGPNKLLATFDGEKLIRRTVREAIASKAEQVIVVTGHMESEIRAALDGLDVQFIHNVDYADGLATSVKAGIDAVPARRAGALILLGDMPGVDQVLIDQLIDAFEPAEQRAIVLATSAGKRGNPVLWARQFFPELMRIAGDTGARHLIAEHEAVVHRIETGAAAVIDVDTPEMLKAAGGKLTD